MYNKVWGFDEWYDAWTTMCNVAFLRDGTTNDQFIKTDNILSDRVCSVMVLFHLTWSPQNNLRVLTSTWPNLTIEQQNMKSDPEYAKS